MPPPADPRMRWIDAPLAPIAGAFALGVGAAHLLAAPPDAAAPGQTLIARLGWMATVLVAGALLGFGVERAATVAILGAITGLGLIHAGPHPRPPNHVALLRAPIATRLEGRIVREPVRSPPDRTRVSIETEALVRNGARRRATGLVALTIYGVPPTPLIEGQRIAVDARLTRPRSFRNPHGFDYAAHLARQDVWVVGTGRAEDLVVLAADPPWNVAFRRWARARIDAAVPPVSAALLGGLLFGDRTGLPPELNEAFRRAGVYHILAVSGFNVALLTAGVFAVLALARVPRRVSGAVAIVASLAFACIVGGGASVLRATVMAVLVLAAVVLGRESSLVNSVALAGIVILALRPGDLAEPGFQLSFGATLGIILFAPPIRSALLALRWPRWLGEATAVSLAAQLVVAPILLAHFNQLCLIGVAANIAVVPLAAVCTGVGMLAVLIGSGSEWLSRAFLDGLWPILLALRGVVFLSARAPGAMLHLPAPHWSANLAFYAGLAALAAAVRPPPAPEEHAEPRRPRRPRVSRACLAPVALVTLGIAIELWPLVRPNGRLRITFLDVGQGDAIVIEFPQGQVALVDGGPGGPTRLDTGERVVAPYLWNRGVRRLALVVTTHDDVDHAGGLPAVRRLFTVDEQWSADRGLFEIPRFFGGAGIVPLAPRRGLLPPYGPRRAADRNNHSVVLRVDFGLASILLTGDIEQEAEQYLVAARAPLRAVVLKVPHHGAQRSASDQFVRAVAPRVAVISVGARNPFGHPAPDTVDRLRQTGARIYRTDRDGAVILETDGRELTITTWADRRTERLELGPGPGHPPPPDRPTPDLHGSGKLPPS